VLLIETNVGRFYTERISIEFVTQINKIEKVFLTDISVILHIISIYLLSN